MYEDDLSDLLWWDERPALQTFQNVSDCNIERQKLCATIDFDDDYLRYMYYLNSSVCYTIYSLEYQMALQDMHYIQR